MTTSTVPLDIHATSFNHVPHFEHVVHGKSLSQGDMEVDNDSLGFEQREVLAALYQEQLQQLQQDNVNFISKGQISQQIQTKSYFSRSRVQDMYWGSDDQQEQIIQNDLSSLGDGSQFNFEESQQQYENPLQQQQQELQLQQLQQQQQQQQQQQRIDISQIQQRSQNYQLRGFFGQIGRIFFRQTT
eukprot:TRINITY_DN21470_c3_g1_i1.p2 TRINITY_DN21470_c3_g1~~TRINITY_DN21470_c3_g1_i1.p2  ORF type:complete len:197 (-),score=24.05 TRINITY_DN21470_c3_g1_i1:194-751(-)